MYSFIEYTVKYFFHGWIKSILTSYIYSRDYSLGSLRFLTVLYWAWNVLEMLKKCFVQSFNISLKLPVALKNFFAWSFLTDALNLPFPIVKVCVRFAIIIWSSPDWKIKKENRLSYSQRCSVYNVDNKELFHKARSSFVFNLIGPPKHFVLGLYRLHFARVQHIIFSNNVKENHFKWLLVWGVFLIIILQKKFGFVPTQCLYQESPY